ncbi:arginine--tRNA ligase [Shouchella clausii]|uniref:arginine--tRNA ligase n=1 Tax=Shouchella clausii TaxID=79880 RepID=UPI0026FF0359|nr:arginine--tRNA ligase [Shouchella clausii]MDO7267273.1 arginine--tRNA ligase [Shouchella clausii]MDO7287773.1 arginine--tRNA ligase [Shouchella clausii]
MHVEQTLIEAIAAAASEFQNDIDVELEQPAQLIHGDYSTNVAMKLARVARKNPLTIAETIKEKLERQRLPVTGIEVVKPGFINFFIEWDEALADGDEPQALSSSGKTVIEHTSINPNKSAHIGHLRNACIGDTLARLLKTCGENVEVHNYVDDLGNQLADTLTALLHTNSDSEATRFGDYCWNVYSRLNEAYDKGTISTSIRDEVLHKLEEGNNSTAWLGYVVADKITSEHIEEMGQFGIDYDLLVWERDIVQKGFWQTAFQKLKQSDVFIKQDSGPQAGCWVLRMSDNESEEGSEHQSDKVLVRSNGVLTYTAKDIAYHMWKFGLLDDDFAYKEKWPGLWTTASSGVPAAFGRGDAVINVIDYRQEYPQKVVKQALAAVGYEKEAERLFHVPYGVVSLSKQTASQLGLETEDGKSVYAMSGRKGIGIKISELIQHMKEAVRAQSTDASEATVEALAFAAIRYNMLRYNTTSDIVFDLTEATQVTGNTGIYLIYTYARANSIITKAKQAGLSPEGATFKGAEDAERALLKHLAGWDTVKRKAAASFEPNLICTFAFELASLYNRFYSQCPVLKADPLEQAKRLAITERVSQQLERVFMILGLPSLKKI